ncbi:hypothetical protein Scel_36310 [Streptomyces cellostaticus]|nr:hypothetical protein Scel_36310 [Streptomyces cellostaticus]
MWDVPPVHGRPDRPHPDPDGNNALLTPHYWNILCHRLRTMPSRGTDHVTEDGMKGSVITAVMDTPPR